MGLQESFSRAEDSVPFGFVKPKVKRFIDKRIKRGRGFASMEDRKRKKINARGGMNAHKNPKHLRCHEFTSEEARKVALKRWGKL